MNSLGVSFGLLIVPRLSVPTVDGYYGGYCCRADTRAFVVHRAGAFRLSVGPGMDQRSLPRLRLLVVVHQVRERAHLSPAELVTRLEAALPRARARTAKMPRLIRKVPLDVPPIGREAVAYLHDRITNRDTWLHRVDLCRATGKQLELTADHDGRLVADVVADWSQRHGQPFRLELSGPAGGIYAQGAGGEEHHLDAVDFCRTLSGRTAGTGVLTHPLVF